MIVGIYFHDKGMERLFHNLEAPVFYPREVNIYSTSSPSFGFFLFTYSACNLEEILSQINDDQGNQIVHGVG
jgi:hypothetical protein